MNTQKDNIIFGGDSFTWGQGIQYYGKFDDIKIMPGNQFIKDYLTDEHIEFIKKNRFGKLVCDFFNYQELIKEENGGSDSEAINFIYNNINEKTKAVVLQTTQPIRSPYKFIYENKEYEILPQNLHIENLEGVKNFKKHLFENDTAFEDWFYDHKKKIILEIEKLSNFLLEKNVIFILISWTNEYNDLLQINEILKKFILKFKYKNSTYSTIETLMSIEQQLRIAQNHEYFGENTPPDWHMSLECHKIISENIIENLNHQLTSQSLNSAAKQSIL